MGLCTSWVFYELSISLKLARYIIVHKRFKIAQNDICAQNDCAAGN